MSSNPDDAPPSASPLEEVPPPVADPTVPSDEKKPPSEHSIPTKPPTTQTRLPDQSGASDDDLLTKTLKFLSTATPETLGGIGIGLAAATYIVLGKLGLVLIGAFGGVVLFISYEARHPEISRAVRGERGVEVLQRLGIDKVPETKTEDEKVEEERLINSFDDFKPETRDALSGLVDAVVRDYVKWWYSPILPSDSSFPLACRKVLNSFLLSVSNALYRKRPADSFLDFLTNTSSIVIVFLSELSAAFADVSAESNVTAADAVYNYLSENPDSSLASLLSQTQQATKFRMVAEDLLQYLDRQTHKCDPARVFLREILAGVMLEMSLQTCSKPEWINGWIVYLLEAGEPDFSQAIDVGMQTGPDANAMNNNLFADIDGNVGNIALAKGNRNSFELEKSRRKESMTHRKKLSKADEEMEEAMEEMKRMNALLAHAERQSSKETPKASPAAEKPAQFAEDRTSNDTDGQRPISISGEISPSSQTSMEKPSVDSSSKRESLQSPITPRSPIDTSSQGSSPKPTENGTNGHFTSFDQIVPPAKDEPEAPGEGPRKPLLTLHNANIVVHDDAPTDSARIRNKPTWDYLVQIEPASSHYAGWMIVRKYSDFETLHEILRRIANISGATAFTEQHTALPNWKLHSRSSLRGELERYVRDACWYQPLAESEGMKRFLEKENGHSRGESKGGVLGWDAFSKNMTDVLSLGSKGAMEGSKAVFGGVTGVFNNIGLGPRRQTTTNTSLSDIQVQSNRLSLGSAPRMESTTSLTSQVISPGGPRKPRDSLDSQRSSIVSIQPGMMAPMERRPSYDSRGELEPEGLKPRVDRWERGVPNLGSREHSRASSLAALRSPLRSPSTLSLDGMKFPMPADEQQAFQAVPTNGETHLKARESMLTRENSSTSVTSPLAQTHTQKASVASPTTPSAAAAPKAVRQYAQLSEQETHVAVELVFAVINEMYTLSSAWNIRRTLLAAAKSFLLRPGNPSLLSIQKMMQESVIEANTNDAGMAHHLRKMRENTMPTDEERASWPAEMTTEEKEKLRIKARRMLIERGVPAALTGVMGQAATTDALGRIFDCLQMEEVARGLMFGIMLQAVRVVTH
ncbi:hypothetical protein ACHAQA_001969 [Verticillium albo-atrum]